MKFVVSKRSCRYPALNAAIQILDHFGPISILICLMRAENKSNCSRSSSARLPSWHLQFYHLECFLASIIIILMSGRTSDNLFRVCVYPE